jgi:hypothetical protein
VVSTADDRPTAVKFHPAPKYPGVKVTASLNISHIEVALFFTSHAVSMPPMPK